MSATTILAGQRITAAWLNSNIPGPWQSISLTGWTSRGSGNVNAQCRLFNSVTAEVIGVCNTNGVYSGTVMTLPAGMTPASQQTAEATIFVTAVSGGGTFELVIATSGAISPGVAFPANTAVAFHFFVSLDA